MNHHSFRVIRGPHTLENLDAYIHDLPIVTQGMPKQINQWAEDNKLRWKSQPNMLFSGYYVDDSPENEGNCYYPSSL